MSDSKNQTSAHENTEKPAAPAGRRDFLKGVATASAAGVAMVQQAQAAAPAAAAVLSPADAKAEASGRLIPRPGSDFMVDVIKSLNVEYVAANPGSSFRSLHESVVNYGGNKSPEFITCLHEESSVAIAHGYAKAGEQGLHFLRVAQFGNRHRRRQVFQARQGARLGVDLAQGADAQFHIKRDVAVAVEAVNLRRAAFHAKGGYAAQHHRAVFARDGEAL